MTNGINSPQEAWVSQLLENRDALCAFLYMHLRNWHETEDLFQEISLVIMRKANEGLEVRHFKAWSREIARRTLLDHWKKKKKIPLPLSDPDLEAYENAWRRRETDPQSLAERMERLKVCLERLSADLRRMLGLRYEDDLSLRQIAGEIGRTEGAVQVALSRARTVLLRCMQTVKTDEQTLIALISGYLDNSLSPEETERLRTIIRTDPAAADLMCELTIQHVQLRRIFNPNIAREISNVRPPGFGVNDLRRSCSGLTLSNQQSASRLVSVEQVKKAEATVPRPAFSAARVSGRFRPALRPLALAACLAIIAAAGLWLAEFLRAPAAAIQLVRFQDGTIFQLLPGTTARIVDPGSASSGKIIKLTAGKMIGDAARQSADFPLRVITPHLEVIVAGTRFTCKVERDHTHVCMHHGWAHIVHDFSNEKLKLEKGFHIIAGRHLPFKAHLIHEKD